MSRKFGGKTPEQLARAEAERAANACARSDGKPLPFASPFEALDPTKVRPGASPEEIEKSYEAFCKLCPPRRRIAHEL